MTTVSKRDPLTDYSAEIKAEIERDVKVLIERLAFKEDDGWEPVNRVDAQYIELGALINLHHGRDLYAEGDHICGVPVRIDRDQPRTIRVGADDVLYWTEVWEDAEDPEGKGGYEEIEEKRDVYVEIRW